MNIKTIELFFKLHTLKLFDSSLPKKKKKKYPCTPFSIRIELAANENINAMFVQINAITVTKFPTIKWKI